MKKLIRTLPFLLIYSCFLPAVQAQQVWPGDVDNNGRVEHIDVLYLGFAFGSTGPQRPGGYTSFSGQSLTERWEMNFPDGINFAYADTDGNGQVEAFDLTAIDTFYGKTHGEVIFEKDFPTAADAPPLIVTADRQTVMGNEAVSMSFALGTSGQPIDNFYGIAFSFRYDPDFMRIDSASVQPLADSWITNGEDPDEALLFIFKDHPDEGRADIAIVRKDQQGIPGHGPIATATIVIETIVIGPAEEEIRYGVDSVFLIDDEFSTAPIGWTQGSLGVTTVQTRHPGRQPQPSVFPNPNQGQFRISLPGAAPPHSAWLLHDSRGRSHPLQIRQLSLLEYSVTVPAYLPSGWYILTTQTPATRYQSPVMIH